MSQNPPFGLPQPITRLSTNLNDVSEGLADVFDDLEGAQGHIDEALCQVEAASDLIESIRDRITELEVEYDGISRYASRLARTATTSVLQLSALSRLRRRPDGTNTVAEDGPASNLTSEVPSPVIEVTEEVTDDEDHTNDGTLETVVRKRGRSSVDGPGPLSKKNRAVITATAATAVPQDLAVIPGSNSLVRAQVHPPRVQTFTSCGVTRTLVTTKAGAVLVRPPAPTTITATVAQAFTSVRTVSNANVQLSASTGPVASTSSGITRVEPFSKTGYLQYPE